MPLSKAEMMDLMVEEKQIDVTIEKAKADREAAKREAEQTYLAALTAADDAYALATQAAESRLLDVRRTLKQDGTWKGSST